MGEHQQDLGWRPPVYFALGAVAALTFVWVWPDWNAICPVDESNNAVRCIREWVGATSGWFAVIAAAFTIVVMVKQLAQAQRFRDEERRNRLRQVAATLVLDLMETSSAAKLGPIDHFRRALSSSAESLISEAVMIAPMLAAALKRHCGEVKQLQDWTESAGFDEKLAFDVNFKKYRNAVAYRSKILALCRNAVDTPMLGVGPAAFPCVSKEVVAKTREEFKVDETADSYLARFSLI